MLLALPNELVVGIVRALDGDVKALRNVALTSRALLPIAQEVLFEVANLRGLHRTCIHPYFSVINELRVVGKVEGMVCAISKPPASLILYPHAFPKLKAIRLIYVGRLFYMRMSLSFLTAVTRLTALTELTLCGATFVNLGHIQSLIRSLARLSRLSLSNIEFAQDMFPTSTYTPLPGHIPAVAAIRPKLAHLSIAPTNSTMASAEVARWLGSGPSRDSLTTLVIAHLSEAPQVVLDCFGSSVEHLRMPLRDLDASTYSGYLDGYTSLRTVTVFLEAYNTSQGPWYLLAPFFERGIPTAECLHTITIDVRIGYPMSLSSAIDWTVLNRLNDALDEDKFRALQKVVVILQWREALGWKPDWVERETVARSVRARLYNLDGEGKLEARLQTVEEFYDTIPGSTYPDPDMERNRGW
ncbi:hypothetical protein C8Q70DRAFT_1056311 [Cubamyces menziesii]|nr:hypothetical protein C8Q70DRAFT_1056311 [Cubamyces menziesii]